ncbi:hypothetical protein [Pseudoalteromonas marina]|uniref:Uncharacterized protein n=1 Tax=Pseudoalteromonas marina TaxID=267375 RepID=A0ABT9FBX9_9GAMM|nr:hypothetical protein [Pseudoalteromonas marina]MDP2564277.1 hypothetical protein [Pseudoalteromonas marina]
MAKFFCMALTFGYFVYNYSVFGVHLVDLLLMLSLVGVLVMPKDVSPKTSSVRLSCFFALFVSFNFADGLLLTGEQFLKLNNYASYNEGAATILKQKNIDIGELGYFQASRLLLEFDLRGFVDIKPDNLEIELN